MSHQSIMHVSLSGKSRAHITSGTKAGNKMSTTISYFNFAFFCSLFSLLVPLFQVQVACILPGACVLWTVCCKLSWNSLFSTKSTVTWNLIGMREAVFSLMHSESSLSLIDWFGKDWWYRLTVQRLTRSLFNPPQHDQQQRGHHIVLNGLSRTSLNWRVFWSQLACEAQLPVVPCTIIHLPCLI